VSEPSLHADTDPRILNVLRALGAERVDRDELLDAFMGFSVGLPSVEFGLWVQLLVDGRLVCGRTMSEEHSASRLDQDVAASFRTFEETAAENEQQPAEVVLGWMESGHFAGPVADRTKRRRDLFDRIKTERTSSVSRSPNSSGSNFPPARRGVCFSQQRTPSPSAEVSFGLPHHYRPVFHDNSTGGGPNKVASNRHSVADEPLRWPTWTGATPPK